MLRGDWVSLPNKWHSAEQSSDCSVSLCWIFAPEVQQLLGGNHLLLGTRRSAVGEQQRGVNQGRQGEDPRNGPPRHGEVEEGVGSVRGLKWIE